MRRNKLSILFNNGAAERWTASRLPEGYVPTMTNWVPDITGVRPRMGWSLSVTTGTPPTTPRIIGIGVYPSSNHLLVAHQESTTSVDIWRNTSSGPPVGSWSSVESVAVDGSQYMVSFAYGLGYSLYTHPAFSTIRSWEGTTAASVASSPPGRTLAFHKNRFFSAGTTANPSRLWFSELGSHSSWPSNNYVEVNQDDAFAIECILPTEDGLLIGKETGLWLLTGSGPDNFALHRLNAGACVRGNSMANTPYGVVIAGPTEAWLWDGGTPRIISDPIRTAYSTAAYFKSVTYSRKNEYVYIGGDTEATLYAYHLPSGAWSYETLASSRQYNALFAYGHFIYSGLRNPQAGDPPLLYRVAAYTAAARDSGMAETFTVKTPELVLGTASAPAVVRHIYVQYRQTNGDSADAGLVVTPTFDGTAGTAQTISAVSSPAGRARRARIDFGMDAYVAQFQFQATLTASDDAIYDIEEVIVEYDVEEDR